MNTQEIPIGGRLSVCPNNVILLMADINYTYFFLDDGSKVMVATTLKMLESRFYEHNFFRIHKSYLINMAYVKSYFAEAGNIFVEMQNDEIILVARRRKRVLQEKLQITIIS